MCTAVHCNPVNCIAVQCNASAVQSRTKLLQAGVGWWIDGLTDWQCNSATVRHGCFALALCIAMNALLHRTANSETVDETRQLHCRNALQCIAVHRAVAGHCCVAVRALCDLAA